MKISSAVQNAAADAVAALFDGGSVQIYTGAPPADPAAAPTGILLGTLTLGTPAFGASANGTVTANAVSGDSAADASGTAGWFRALDSSGNTLEDGTITATDGGGDMEMDEVNIVQGGSILMSAWTITMPGS